jgi:hypothetical protein
MAWVQKHMAVVAREREETAEDPLPFPRTTARKWAGGAVV